MTAKYVDWTADKSDRKGDGKSRFLKLSGPNNKYRIRLIGKSIKYAQHWDPIPVRSPGRDKDGNVIDPLMQAGFEPQVRFSCWVIDRDDNNEFKIIDFPEGLHAKFCAWKDEFKDEPGGRNGPDFRITVTGVKKSTRYEVMPLDRTPLTEADIAKAHELDIHKQLAELRKDHTPEEIMQKWNEAKASGAPSTPAQAAAQAAQREAPKAAPAAVPATTAAAAAPAPAAAAAPASDDLNF